MASLICDSGGLLKLCAGSLYRRAFVITGFAEQLAFAQMLQHEFLQHGGFGGENDAAIHLAMSNGGRIFLEKRFHPVRLAEHEAHFFSVNFERSSRWPGIIAILTVPA